MCDIIGVHGHGDDLGKSSDLKSSSTDTARGGEANCLDQSCALIMWEGYVIYFRRSWAWELSWKGLRPLKLIDEHGQGWRSNLLRPVVA